MNMDKLKIPQLRKICRVMEPKCKGSKYIKRDDMIRFINKKRGELTPAQFVKLLSKAGFTIRVNKPTGTTAKAPPKRVKVPIKKAPVKKSVVKKAPIKNVAQIPTPIKFLTGIRQLTYLKHPKMQYNFLLFGEVHTSTVNAACGKNLMTSPEWIMKLLRTKHRKFMDVYIERAYVSPNKISPLKPSADNGLQVLRRELYDCLLREKTKCPFKNTARIHYADVRYIDRGRHRTQYKHTPFELLSPFDKFFGILRLLYHYGDLRNKPKYVAVTHSLYEALPTHDIRVMLNNTFAVKKIRKQIINVPYLSIRKILAQSLNTELASVMDAWNSTDDYMDDIVKLPLHAAYTKFFDLYVLARCFRVYKQPSNTRKQNNPYHPKFSFNNLVYAGAKHTRHMRELLLSMGFKIIFNSEDNEAKMCVDVTGFKYP